MRLNSKHKHKQSGRVYELQRIQQPVKDRQWLILKCESQKMPISVSKEDFESNYEEIAWNS
mgnify:CR=1 FL=1